MYFSLSRWELHGLVAILLHPDDGPVVEYALFATVGKQVLDGLVGKCDLIRSVGIMLLHLPTTEREVGKIIICGLKKAVCLLLPNTEFLLKNKFCTFKFFSPFKITINIKYIEHCITDVLLCRLQRVQNNAARVVSGSKKYDHITPVLKDIQWLPIRKRIKFKILLLTFKCMHGCAPLAIWIIHICQLITLHKALLNIIGGKGAISNIINLYAGGG